MDASLQIKQKARGLGFDLVGIAPARPPPDFDFFRWWLDQGFAGTMAYLRRGLGRRGDPEKILPGVNSVIVCGLNYYTGNDRSIDIQDPNKAWISSYAWGEDYHKVVGERLKRLEDFIRREVDPRAETRSYVDTGPILERSYAARAGVGWIGKNTCLLNNGLGSYLFLGEILTTLELPSDRPVPDQCGTCTCCLEACPTGALVEPYVMDATRCISYLTIEYRGEFSPQQCDGIGQNVYGCDICQEVCPYNDRLPLTSEERLYPRPGWIGPTLKDLQAISRGDFEEIRSGSAMERIRWDQWQRNLKARGDRLTLPSRTPMMVSDMETAAVHTDRPLLQVTERAADKVKAFASGNKEAEGKFFRVYVQGGGCSGFQYGFNFDTLRDDDQQIEAPGGITVLVDPITLPYVQGSMVDYVEDFGGSGFVVQNPNATGSCGCGHSFSV